MKTHMRRPESQRLALADGHWLLVKKYLTAGEERRMSGRAMTLAAGETRPTIDLMKVGTSQCVTYLLDWSLVNADGDTIVIRDQPENVVEAALDGIDGPAFVEVHNAINKHIEAMAALQEQEKKETAIDSESLATSTSAA